VQQHRLPPTELVTAASSPAPPPSGGSSSAHRRGAVRLLPPVAPADSASFPPASTTTAAAPPHNSRPRQFLLRSPCPATDPPSASSAARSRGGDEIHSSRPERDRSGRITREQNRKKQRTTKTNCFVCVFLAVAGDGDSHRRQGREEKEKAGQIRPFPASAAASNGGALEHAPPAFLHEFLQFLEHFPCNFWSFKDHFVNLKLFYVIFIYF